MGLSAAALGHIGCGSGVPPAAPLFDWATVSGATAEWDADDLANGAQIGTTWTDRINGYVFNPQGNPVRSAGINGRGRVLHDGTAQHWKSTSGVPLAMIGGSLGSDYLILCVAELIAANAQNTGSWDDAPIFCDSGFRMGMSFRKRTSAPDQFAVNGWVNTFSAFQFKSYDIGTTLPAGVHIYHERKQGTSLYSGFDGAWSTAEGVGANITSAMGAELYLATMSNETRHGNLYVHKLCVKGGSGTDEPAAIAAFLAEYS